MQTELRPASADERSIIDKLFQFYVYDLSSLTGKAIDNAGEFRFSADLVSKYWCKNSHWPYLIYANGELAGFCLIRKYPGETTFDIDQFFVLNRFKRHGIGSAAFEKIIELHPGRWIIRVLKENTSALKFWMRCADRTTHNDYTLALEMDDDLEMHFIRFTSG